MNDALQSGPVSVRGHRVLLEDRVRTRAYRRAIEKMVTSRTVVLDSGCGTGMLSLFAARAGCRHVYSVDRSAIVAPAAETAARNGLGDTITFVQADACQYQPPRKVDLVVHEHLGTHLFDENVIAIIANLRSRVLKKGGRIVPSSVDIYLVPCSAGTPQSDSCDFWGKDQYGFDLTAFHKQAFLEEFGGGMFPSRAALMDQASFLCRPQHAHRIDFYRDSFLPAELNATFACRKPFTVRSICLYFKVNLCEGISFSSGPSVRGTHWGQILLPLLPQVEVPAGVQLKAKVLPSVSMREWRWEIEAMR